jgi:hypothetical protein
MRVNFSPNAGFRKNYEPFGLNVQAIISVRRQGNEDGRV